MISANNPLILGSASPRRRDILTGLGIAIRTAPANVPEETRPGEVPSHYLERIVRDKLQGVARSLGTTAFAGVLVADTIVVIDGEILGKPNDKREAAQLVSKLVGRKHTVFTRYAISLASNQALPAVERTVETLVTLRAASTLEVEAYANTGEGLDKAGAYAAQGIGAFLVERIEGSYSNVVGLPACEVIVDLKAVGLLGDFPL
jgi:septum formation protein